MSRRSVAVALLLLAIAAPQARAQDPKPFPDKVETGFDPKVDGLPFFNGGNYGSQGDCIGMSIVAIDRFLRRKAGEKMPENEKIRERETDALVGDPVDHLVTAAVQVEAKKVRVEAQKLDDPSALRAALIQMKEDGRPVTLGLDSKKAGHSVVLFGYKDGKLQIYDPNFPGETMEWTFDPKTGLGKPYRGDKWDTVAVLPLEKFPVSADLKKIREQCGGGAKECTEAFPAVTATVTPAADKKSVTVTGTVSRGKKKSDEGDATDPPKIVFLRVNGVLQKMPAKLKADGSYSITLPASALEAEGENVIQVIAATRYALFAGYTQAPAFTLGPRKGVLEALSSPK